MASAPFLKTSSETLETGDCLLATTTHAKMGIITQFLLSLLSLPSCSLAGDSAHRPGTGLFIIVPVLCGPSDHTCTVLSGFIFTVQTDIIPS